MKDMHVSLLYLKYPEESCNIEVYLGSVQLVSQFVFQTHVYRYLIL